MERIDSDELIDRLREWSAEQRVETAAAERSADRWRKQLASETTHLTALARDVMERRLAVTLRVDNDRFHKGTIAAVYEDYFVVVSEGRPVVLVTWNALRSLEVEGRARTLLSSSRDDTVSTMSLAEMLSRLAEDRPRIRVATLGNANVSAGELVSVGDDVLALELDGEKRRTQFIPLSQIAEVTVG